MALLVIIGVALLGAAAALGARAMSFGRVRMAAQLRQIDTYGFSVEAREDDEADKQSTVAAAANSLAERLGRFAAVRLGMAPLRRSQLLAAGLYRVSPEALSGYRLLLGGSLAGLLLLNGIASGLSPQTVLLAIVVGALGFVVPKLLVVRRAQRRLNRIDRDIPELIDVLTATIEAGLSVGGSLQMVADRFRGPLGSELRLTLREQTMGLSTEKALENMVQRCDTPSIRAFVRAVRQAEALGVSIGSMMRNLAQETRDRRRQLAHERVQKAPVKLLFPLVFLIFPAMLIVLLYPSVHNIIHQLSHGG